MKTSPQFGFGSSKREKDYMSLSKKQTPGPGAYRIPMHIGKTPAFAIPNKDARYTRV